MQLLENNISGKRLIDFFIYITNMVEASAKTPAAADVQSNRAPSKTVEKRRFRYSVALGY